MNVILISTGSRPALLRQTLDSMVKNAADWTQHTLTVILDGTSNVMDWIPYHTLIVNSYRQGASASRNIGAGSIPRHKRQEFVMFCDDDVAFLSGWDSETAGRNLSLLMSPCAHPFNHDTGQLLEGMNESSVLSTVAMVMPWKAFDYAGPWDEPGGSGGSEDVAFCKRAVDSGYRLGVCSPHRAIHCGLTSSTGWPIVGARELEAMNHEMILKNGLAGKVLMQ